MKKKSSIVKLSIIGVLIIVGMLLSFCTVNVVGFKTYNSFVSSIKLDLGLEGGISALYEVDLESENFSGNVNDAQDGLYDILLSRGYSEIAVTKEGEDKLRIELADINDAQTLLQNIGSPAKFKVVDSSNKELASSKHIVATSAGYYDNSYIVSIELNGAGKKIVGANSDNDLKIVTTQGGADTDRQTSVLPNNIIYISGLSSMADAQKLADAIMSGTLNVDLSLKEMASVPATLGENAALAALIAGIVAMAIILVLIFIKYRLLGVVVALSMMVQAIVLLFFLAVFPWMTFNIFGIIAFLLCLALGFDACINLIERIRQEYSGGKSIAASTHYGFKKSLKTIIDSHLVALLIAIVFLVFPTASIKAFGFTILAGVVLSALCTLLLSRKLLKYVFAIFDTKVGLLSLRRSEAYAGLGADQTASDVQEKMDFEAREKARIARERQAEDDARKAAAKASVVKPSVSKRAEPKNQENEADETKAEQPIEVEAEIHEPVEIEPAIEAQPSETELDNQPEQDNKEELNDESI